MISLTQRWQSLQRALSRAANAEITQRAHTVLTRDLPAWLVELGTLAPVELHTVSADLAGELGRLVRVCASERRGLRGRGACRPLALKLTVDRVAGALVPLEAALARTTLALRRSDPRLAAVGAANLVAAVGGATRRPATSGALTAATGPLAANITITARDSRALARSLRATLAEAARAAHGIERALRRATQQEPDASPSAIAGAIEQTRTLAAWLRQEGERAAGQVLCRVS